MSNKAEVEAAKSLFSFLDDLGSDNCSIVFLEVLFEEMYGKAVSVPSETGQESGENSGSPEQQQDLPTSPS